MIEVAKRYVGQKQFVATPDSLVYGGQYVKLMDAVQHAAVSRSDAETISKLTHAIFPDLKQVIADKRFLDDKRRVHESLVALQVAPSEDNDTSTPLIDLSRAIDILERVAANDASIGQPGAAVNATTRIVVLPPGVFPVPSPLVGQAPQAGDPPSFQSSQTSEQVTALRNAIAAVNAMITANTPSPVSSQEMPAVPDRKLAQLANAEARTVPKDKVATLQTRSLKSAGAQIAERIPTVAGAQALTPQVQKTLSDLQIDLTKSSLISVSEQLKQLLQVVGLGPPAPDPFHEPAPPLESLEQPPTFLAAPPNSHGSVMPAGIADLLVVREHALRYESGEIAFVENVAAGELFKRQTVRKNTSQNSTLTSIFSGSQTERDLQTSDRFNLQQQVQSTANQSTSAGANASSYGPLVDSADSSSLSTAATSSTAAASGYAQDITSRAVSNLAASRQTDVFQQTTTEFDETVERGVDNTKAGSSPEIAVYQWLDKIVQAKVFSYGKRALYDFVIPEPAVFLAYSRKSSQPALARLQEPTLFDLQPDKLSTDPKSDYFYQRWAAGYGATNVQPPPEPTVTVARAYGDKGSNPQGDSGDVLFNGVGAKDVIDVPAGYQAAKAYVSFDYFGGAPNMAVDVVVGDAYFGFSQPATPNDSKDLGRHQVGQIPVNISVWNAGIFTVNIEIVCERTDQSFAQWKARTHDTILQASRDRQAEYEDQLRKLTADVQIRYAGQSSEEKQTLIRAELEKSCVTILSNQHFDVLNTIEYAPFPTVTPQLFLPNFDPVSRYIRFFEQAFEWDQMLYKYLPYFWGRKKYWSDRMQLDDQDSEFAAFLRAGAARVTVPVRKGYEIVVAAFMNNGTIPSTADMLAVTTGLYVPFFAELMGRDGGPDTAVSYGDPPLEWEIRVPTTLVKLRTNNTLPRWKQMVDAGNHVTYAQDVPGDPLTP
ncbi:hypothetical protein [Paraburkholderia sediminicola]|uniref:hypothetical protein n=1 Tax=Paraburkholderia sediminicola TaxID=458836 RepID=UPI0038BD3BD3